MSKHIIPKAEFAALLESLNHTPEEAAHKKLWFAIADRCRQGWNGMKYAELLESLTSGQSALFCLAQFYRFAESDILMTLTQRSLCCLTLKALETVGAVEYLELLRTIGSVFPGSEFPKYAEDLFRTIRKQPKYYFDEMTEKIVSGVSMERPLHCYIFDYITSHLEEFCSESFEFHLKLLKASGAPPTAEGMKNKSPTRICDAPARKHTTRSKRGDDPFALIRSAKTGGPNFGLGTGAIIAHLTEWQKICSFDITGAERDTVDIKFNTLPKDMDAFVKELYEFCPDIIDQGTGCVHELIGVKEEMDEKTRQFFDGVDFDDENYGLEVLKRQIQAKRAIVLWWD